MLVALALGIALESQRFHLFERLGLSPAFSAPILRAILDHRGQVSPLDASAADHAYWKLLSLGSVQGSRHCLHLAYRVRATQYSLQCSRTAFSTSAKALYLELGS